MSSRLLILNHLAFMASHRGSVSAIPGGYDVVSEKKPFDVTFAFTAQAAVEAANRSRTLYVPDWLHGEVAPLLPAQYSETHSLTYMERLIVDPVAFETPALPELSLVRASTPAEIDDFAAAQIGGFCETPESLATYGEWMRAADHRGWASAQQHFYVGYVDGRPVTCALVVDHASIAGVYAVATLPSWRRRGLSRIAMQFALSQARARGFGLTGLQVLTGSPAERYYELLGYCALFRMHVFT